MMKYCLLASLVAIAYASPLNYITATSAPPPSIDCPNDLCTNKPDGNYRHTRDSSFFVTCINGKAQSCQRCDREGTLHFNEHCNQCRPPLEADSFECDYYTGSTKPNLVCSDDDNKYAIWFCQNLLRLPSYINTGVEDDGDFVYEVYDTNSFQRISGDRSHFYISCIQGTYGWCRFCPEDLLFHRKVLGDGSVALNEGVCDYPPRD